jgi:hypothetical protein
MPALLPVFHKSASLTNRTSIGLLRLPIASTASIPTTRRREFHLNRQSALLYIKHRPNDVAFAFALKSELTKQSAYIHNTMQASTLSLSIALLATTVPLSAALKFNFYASAQSRSAAVEEMLFGLSQSCQTKNSGVSSVAVSNTGSVGNPYWAIFFSSDDCNPDTVCFSEDFKIYQVWRVMSQRT